MDGGWMGMDVMPCGTSWNTPGMAILKQVLTQLLLYYTRLQKATRRTKARAVVGSDGDQMGRPGT